MFREYVSNIAAGTGTNYIIETGEVKTYRVRAYMKPLLAGDFNWAFSYVNAVNSTFAKGDVAWCNKEGGNFRINYAFIADGGEIGGLDVTPTEDFVRIPVTFGGEASRDVTPGEVFRSDPVRIALPENHYLLFEWELTGDGIPGTPDSQSAAFIEKDGVWKPANTAPLPALFGCDRPFKKRVAFLGDSITQGCQTCPNAYEMWAGRIAAMLQPEYAVWNLGLGYARASDAATDGCWLTKAKQADVVIVTLGVNDIFPRCAGKRARLHRGRDYCLPRAHHHAAAGGRCDGDPLDRAAVQLPAGSLSRMARGESGDSRDCRDARLPRIRHRVGAGRIGEPRQQVHPWCPSGRRGRTDRGGEVLSYFPYRRGMDNIGGLHGKLSRLYAEIDLQSA